METNALAKATLAGEAMDEYDKVQYMPSIDLQETSGTELGFESGVKHNQKKVLQVLILADQKMHTHHNIIFVDVF